MALIAFWYHALLAAALSLPLSLGLPSYSAAQETQPTAIPESPLNLPPKPKPLRRSYAPPPVAEPSHATPKAAKKAKASKPTPVAPPVRSAQPKPRRAAKTKAVRPTPAPAPAPVAKPGSLTRVVQEALHRAGYDVPRDGKLDQRTRQALRKYQRDHGLPVTGKIDRATRARLGIR